MTKHRLAKINAVERIEKMKEASPGHQTKTFEAESKKVDGVVEYVQHTSLQIDALDRPTIHDWRQQRPHWMAYGDGYSTTEISVNSDGSISIIAEETAEGKRNGKKAWGQLSAAGAKALADLILAAQNGGAK